MNTYEKLDKLKNYLKRIGKIAIAFSGGTDSTFLLKTAHEILGRNTLAITVHSAFSPEREFGRAREFIKDLNLKHLVVELDILTIEKFGENPKDRCYYCKKQIFSEVIRAARNAGFSDVADGTNFDDTDDYRPGIRALKELGIVSPLKDANMTKKDIRRISRRMGIKTWKTPSSACLASRIPYGHEITREKLEMVDKAEQYISDLGFSQVRVRHHGDIARIEVETEERKVFLEGNFLEQVSLKLKGMGFKYVTLDLEGYRMGSLNEML
mgnify:CR=1 FL=1